MAPIPQPVLKGKSVGAVAPPVSQRRGVSPPPEGEPATGGSGKLETYTGVEKRGFYIIAYGETWTGKSRLALTAMELGPVAVFDFDQGLHRAFNRTAQTFPNPYPVQVWRRKGNSQALAPRSQALCTADRDDFLESYRDAILSDDIQYLVIDTETELWEVVRFAEFGKISSVVQRYYEAPNGIMRRILKTPMEMGKDLVVVRRTKEAYLKNEPSGLIVGSGFKDAEYEADVVLKTFRAPTPPNQAVDPFREFGAIIEKFGERIELGGQVLWGNDLCVRRIKEIYNGAAMNPEGEKVQ